MNHIPLYRGMVNHRRFCPLESAWLCLALFFINRRHVCLHVISKINSRYDIVIPITLILFARKIFIKNTNFYVQDHNFIIDTTKKNEKII